MDEIVKQLLIHACAQRCALCDACARGINPCKLNGSDVDYCHCSVKAGMICSGCNEPATRPCCDRLLCSICKKRCYAKGACVCLKFLPDKVRLCASIPTDLKQPLAEKIHHLLINDDFWGTLGEYKRTANHSFNTQ